MFATTLPFDFVQNSVPVHQAILTASAEIGFSMSADVQTASLLRTLARSKPGGRFLELGTGTGLSTAWLLAGMDDRSTLISVDNDPVCQRVARRFLGHDARLQLVCQDGAEWLDQNATLFDFIFADTWAGKYERLATTLALLKPGGLYIIDDMLPQPNWPDGHAAKVEQLLTSLDARDNMVLTRLAWSTGLVVAVRKD